MIICNGFIHGSILLPILAVDIFFQMDRSSLMKCNPVINNQAFLEIIMQHQISLNSKGGCPPVLSCNSRTQNIVLNAPLF